MTVLDEDGTFILHGTNGKIMFYGNLQQGLQQFLIFLLNMRFDSNISQPQTIIRHK